MIKINVLRTQQIHHQAFIAVPLPDDQGRKCQKTCKDLVVEASQPGQSLAQQSALFAPTGSVIVVEFIRIVSTTNITIYKTNNIDSFHISTISTVRVGFTI